MPRRRPPRRQTKVYRRTPRLARSDTLGTREKLRIARSLLDRAFRAGNISRECVQDTEDLLQAVILRPEPKVNTTDGRTKVRLEISDRMVTLFIEP